MLQGEEARAYLYVLNDKSQNFELTTVEFIKGGDNYKEVKAEENEEEEEEQEEEKKEEKKDEIIKDENKQEEIAVKALSEPGDIISCKKNLFIYF